MNGYQNPYMNPYGMSGYGQMQANPAMAIPPQQVTKVNGRNGAISYQMGANSSALLLDESGLIVWLCTTDGAGYKTVTAYDITPHQDTPAPDFGSLETRITRLEEMVNGRTADTSATRKKPNGNKPDDSAD